MIAIRIPIMFFPSLVVAGLIPGSDRLEAHSDAPFRFNSRLERQGSGGPSGLQNRQARATHGLEGSIPSPLRLVADAPRPQRACVVGQLLERPRQCLDVAIGQVT